MLMSRPCAKPSPQLLHEPAHRLTRRTLEVTELPVKKWTQDYKEYLETLIKPESKVGRACYALTSLHVMLHERHSWLCLTATRAMPTTNAVSG